MTASLKDAVDRAAGRGADAVLRAAREWMAPEPQSRQETDHFLLSREWAVVRMVALERDGGRCACCGRTAADGIVINVDHIKPRRKYPEHALTVSNLQVLCNECNHGKGNRFQTDWRKPTADA